MNNFGYTHFHNKMITNPKLYLERVVFWKVLVSIDRFKGFAINSYDLFILRGTEGWGTVGHTPDTGAQ